MIILWEAYADACFEFGHDLLARAVGIGPESAVEVVHVVPCEDVGHVQVRVRLRDPAHLELCACKIKEVGKKKRKVK